MPIQALFSKSTFQRTALLFAGVLLSFTSAQLLVTNGQARSGPDGTHVPLPAKCTLRVDNPRGHTRVTLSNRQDMEMLTRRHDGTGPAVRPEEITLEETNGHVAIATRPAGANAGVDLTLSLPEGTTLRLFSEAGDIEVTGAAGGVLATTLRGNVKLTLPDGFNADVVLYSGNGTVHSDLPVKSYGAADDRSLQGAIGKGGPMVMARSERGNVVVTSPGTEKIAAAEPTKDRVIDIRNRSRDDDDRDGKEPAGTRTKPEPLKPDTRPRNASSEATAKGDKSDDDNVLRIESELVTLNASAGKRSGEALTNLRKEDFSLFEDGIQQEIVHFQSVNMPFNLVLLIDLSGSMREKIGVVRRAAMRFIQATRPDDKVAIVTFTSRVRTISPLTNDREQLRQRIQNIRDPDGGTNFYDAVEYALTSVLANVRGERNAIVIMSDGVDNALPNIPGEGSAISYDELFQQIQETDTIIFPIYLDTEEEAVSEFGMKVTRAYAIAQRQLNQLAEATGGTMLRASQVEDLEGRYEQVAAELRTIYSLGYYPTNNTHDGSFRKIRVRVNRDDAQVRARHGYYARKD